jgi:hypothetical protein
MAPIATQANTRFTLRMLCSRDPPRPRAGGFGRLPRSNEPSRWLFRLLPTEQAGVRPHAGVKSTLVTGRSLEDRSAVAADSGHWRDRRNGRAHRRRIRAPRRRRQVPARTASTCTRNRRRHQAPTSGYRPLRGLCAAGRGPPRADARGYWLAPLRGFGRDRTLEDCRRAAHPAPAGAPSEAWRASGSHAGRLLGRRPLPRSPAPASTVPLPIRWFLLARRPWSVGPAEWHDPGRHTLGGLPARSGAGHPRLAMAMESALNRPREARVGDSSPCHRPGR